jgi:O-methyltransferase involved in polyketide biosynthesis
MNMEKTPAKHLLSSTAHWTAAVRARESKREDRLFYDPWAAALASEIGMAWIASRSADNVAPIVIRTRYFDDFLQRITHEHGVLQVVMLAAGARPVCKRQVIHSDLSAAWADTLAGSGFEPNRPSVWLLEGFLFYLINETIVRILDTVTNLAAPGSWLGFDIINSVMLTSPITQKWVEMQAQSGAPWVGTMDDPATYLALRGWQAGLSQAGAADANYGRWPYPVVPVTMPGIPHNWFVTARYDGL